MYGFIPTGMNFLDSMSATVLATPGTEAYLKLLFPFECFVLALVFEKVKPKLFDFYLKNRICGAKFWPLFELV